MVAYILIFVHLYIGIRPLCRAVRGWVDYLGNYTHIN